MIDKIIEGLNFGVGFALVFLSFIGLVTMIILILGSFAKRKKNEEK